MDGFIWFVWFVCSFYHGALDTLITWIVFLLMDIRVSCEVLRVLFREVRKMTSILCHMRVPWPESLRWSFTRMEAAIFIGCSHVLKICHVPHLHICWYLLSAFRSACTWCPQTNVWHVTGNKNLPQRLIVITQKLTELLDKVIFKEAFLSTWRKPVLSMS